MRNILRQILVFRNLGDFLSKKKKQCQPLGCFKSTLRQLKRVKPHLTEVYQCTILIWAKVTESPMTIRWYVPGSTQTRNKFWSEYLQIWAYLLPFYEKYPRHDVLNLPIPCISESCIEIEIMLNFSFRACLWCLKKFYEGLS